MREVEDPISPPPLKRRRLSSPVIIASSNKKGKVKVEANSGVLEVLDEFEHELTCPMYVSPAAHEMKGFSTICVPPFS